MQPLPDVLQNGSSQKFSKIYRNTPVSGSLFKLSCRPQPATLLKKKLRHRCLLVNFAKFLRIPICIGGYFLILFERYNKWF